MIDVPFALIAVVPDTTAVPIFAVEFVAVIVTLQYPGEADTEPGTAAELVVVSSKVLPPNDQSAAAVNLVVLLFVIVYQPVSTLAEQFVQLTVYLP